MRFRSRTLRAGWALLALSTGLLAASPAFALLGYGDPHDGGFIGPAIGSSGTVTFRVSGYGVGDDVDETGFVRWDFQPWRIFGRVDQSAGSQYSNFGMHGGYMPLELGPFGFGVGFGFDFLTVGVPDTAKHEAGTYLAVPFGLEAAVGLKMWGWGRLLFTRQGQAVGGSDFDSTGTRTGMTLEWLIAFGESGFYLMLAGETGGFEFDGESFAAGQGLVGLTWWDF